jgi:Flp pilus assembly pilin Flp
MWQKDEGVTTVEWLGMVFLAVIVIGFLVPEVRNSASEIWTAVTDRVLDFG